MNNPLFHQKAQPHEVSVRFFELADLDDVCKYFFHSPVSFFEARGVRVGAMGTEDEFRQRWMNRIQDEQLSGTMPKVVTVMFKGLRVGVHTSTHFIENESLIMHAHFFHPDNRGKGIGMYSYVKAMELLMTTHNLREIIFKTPTINHAPMRIKEKLGISAIGDEVLDWPLLIPGICAKVFKVDRQELERIKKRIGLA